MKVVLHDKKGEVIGTADISPERINSAGVIIWIDGFFTFWCFAGSSVHFMEADLLPLDDEEVTEI